MNFQNQYKKTTYGFGAIEKSRFLRIKRYEAVRKEERAKNFSRNRPLPMTDNKSNKNNNNKGKGLRTRLLKWKAEKETIKKVEQLKKRPPFKVGIVHHRLYSPPTWKFSPKKPKEIPEKRITRATLKRILAKSSTVSNKDAIKDDKASGKDKQIQNKKVSNSTSFAPANYKFTAPDGIKSIPLFAITPLKDTPKLKKCFQLSPQKSTPMREVLERKMLKNKDLMYTTPSKDQHNVNVIMTERIELPSNFNFNKSSSSIQNGGLIDKNVSIRLTRIDNCDSYSGNSEPISYAANQLDYNDSPFVKDKSNTQNNNENLFSTHNTEVQESNINMKFSTLSIVDTPVKSSRMSSRAKEQSVLKGFVDDNEKDDVPERVLRNKTVICTLTPQRSTRKNKRDMNDEQNMGSQNENKTPLNNIRCSLRISTRNQKHEHD